MRFDTLTAMVPPSHKASRTVLWKTVIWCVLALGMALVPIAFAVENQVRASLPPDLRAFFPGETLTYDISWSKLISAGTATMEVHEITLRDGRAGVKFVVTGRSAGLVDKVYPVHDRVESIFDPLTRESLSYSLQEHYGGKKRRRELAFDHARNIVVSKLNDDPAETFVVPEHVQDGLSTLYYLRTRENFIEGKMFTIDVHDSSKNWSVEIHTLGKERLKTPLGEFSTIKIKTHPKYKGAFLNKGEVLIWLTDDSRKIPVLMKSKLAFGSFVFTLTDMSPEHFLEPPLQ